MSERASDQPIFTQEQLLAQQSYMHQIRSAQVSVNSTRGVSLEDRHRANFSPEMVDRMRAMINAHYPDYYAPDSADLDGQLHPNPRNPAGPLSANEMHNQISFALTHLSGKIGRDIRSRNYLDEPIQPTFGGPLPTPIPEPEQTLSASPAPSPSDTPIGNRRGTPDNPARAPEAEPQTEPHAPQPETQAAAPAPEPTQPAPAEPVAPEQKAPEPQTPASEAEPASAPKSENYNSTRKALMGAGDQVMAYDAGIREAQFKLTGMGMQCGPVDGLEGPLTRGGFDAYAREFNPPLNLSEMSVGQLLTHMDENKAQIEAKYGPRRGGPDLAAASNAPVLEAGTPEADIAPELSMDGAVLERSPLSEAAKEHVSKDHMTIITEKEPGAAPTQADIDEVEKDFDEYIANPPAELTAENKEEYTRSLQETKEGTLEEMRKQLGEQGQDQNNAAPENTNLQTAQIAPTGRLQIRSADPNDPAGPSNLFEDGTPVSGFGGTYATAASDTSPAQPIAEIKPAVEVRIEDQTPKASAPNFTIA